MLPTVPERHEGDHAAFRQNWHLLFSLYLSHQIILSDFSPTIAHWLHLRHGTLFLLGLAPFCLPFAWLCFQIFEKPFLHWSAAIPLTRTPMRGFDPLQAALGPDGPEVVGGRVSL